MHGKDADPSHKWYPWFATEMQTRNIAFEAPTLPETNNPDCDAWVEALDAMQPDDNTILVGHSRGGVAILRWLETLPTSRRVRKVILVATNSGKLAMNSQTTSNRNFFTEKGYDFAAIREHCNDFIVLHSQDDQTVSFDAGKENAQGLDARFHAFDDRGHFGKKILTIPELLEEIK